MPGFIGISGTICLVLGVSYDKSIFCAVCCDPFALPGLGKAVIKSPAVSSRKKIYGKSGVMLASSGICRVEIGPLKSPGFLVSEEEAFLGAIGSVGRTYLEVQSFLFGSGKHCLVSVEGLFLKLDIGVCSVG